MSKINNIKNNISDWFTNLTIPEKVKKLKTYHIANLASIKISKFGHIISTKFEKTSGRLKSCNFKLWDYIKGILTEVPAIIHLAAVYFKKSDLDIEGNGSNIIFFHGFLHNTSPWKKFKSYLKANGSGPVNAVSYTSKQTITEHAAQVNEQISSIKQLTGKPVNILIGHSAGGLVCLEWALEYGSEDQPIYIVTIGSPLHGTVLANAFSQVPLVGKGSKDMQTDSDYLASLHGRLKTTQKHIHLLTISSENDLIIQPIASASLPELVTDENGYSFNQNVSVENQSVSGIGHVRMILSEKIMSYVINFLKKKQALPSNEGEHST
jgi:hypothetical protein